MRRHGFCLFVVLALMAIHSVSPSAASPKHADVAARAEQGDDEAQYLLGRMYQSGQGVAQDTREAVKWYRKSAQQGYPPAERYLGLMYQGGYGGLPKDHVEARRWLSKAAEHGDSLAKFALFLEDTSFVPFVRGLPQRGRDLVFFAILAACFLIALAAGALCVFVLWKTLKRFSRAK